MREKPTAAVLRDLDSATDRYPLDRKLLVSGSMGEGRELLRALGVRRSWIGWEVTTVRRLAMELASRRLSAAGLAVADGYEEQAAVDVALDAALEDRRFTELRELGEAPGFREAVVNAVEAVRLAGIPAARLRATRASNEAVRDLLAAVTEGYVGRLAAVGSVDTADVVDHAVAALAGDPSTLDPDRTFLVPGLSLRGAGGRLAGALLEAGAVVLRSDPVIGPEPGPIVWEPSPEPAPLSALLDGRMTADRAADLELFAASGPADEVREVLRRVMAAGLRWDQVEIIATDPVVYGGALHALAERLDIPVSYAVGLPVERTRTGRAATAWFRWIQTGYPADIIRRLLESGDLRAPGGVSAGALARRIRQLRIGWGSDRYLRTIRQALDRLDGPPVPRRKESEDEAAERVDRERRELEALLELLGPILETAPRLDRRDGGGRLSPADVATGLRTFLRAVTAGDAPSVTARERLLSVTDRIAATLHRATEPEAAIALLRSHLEVRVPAPSREGSAPWVSAGGYLHLSDVEHGGYAHRDATFVVGLDADRFPGSGLQDPLLLDGQRRALDRGALPTAADRIADSRFRMAACLARLRGSVTLSYSAWDPAEVREVAPSAVMLQAFRARTGQPEASFEDLREGLGDAASPVPRSALLDTDDVWFDALDHDRILTDGTEAVRARYPALDAGLRALSALTGDEATAHHGLVRPRPDRLDPRLNESLILSASGLEDLGTCARRYFYKYALGVRKPDDPEHDPDVWLDALRRGSLLHSVYERALREAREAGVRAGDDAFVDIALEALEAEARRMAREVPVPGDAVRSREMAALREDVRSFAEMMAGRDDAWEALELAFGFRGEPPAALELKGGTVRLRGAIDRVDREGGALTVVDYKTGASGRYERSHGTFNGGRRLQNAVYAAVAEALLGGRVERMEYHFPTRKGQNEAIAYRREELRRGLGLIDRLLDGVAEGHFLPTEEGGDCRFCDYAPICRHSQEGFGATTPLADWAKERIGTLPEYEERRETRSWDETFLAELEEHGETS